MPRTILSTSLGVYVDGDKNTLNILENIKEFILMSILIFITLSAIYFSAKFILNRMKASMLSDVKIPRQRQWYDNF